MRHADFDVLDHVNNARSLEAVRRHALARPDVGFSVWHEGKLVEQLRPGTPAQRLADVLGDEFVRTSRDVALTIGPMRIHGRAGLPDAARSRADWQYCYVNGRYVRDKLLAHGVRPGDRVAARWLTLRPPASGRIADPR